ncbi:MAG TPA: 2'-5' RNA ligase family protein [Ensifer sp.]|uniref:2'-5' RNA ligase family protein n=1 Tax=Ensifer sp. TaxID=1872086 RepID=UPI002E15D084|nr:2'-5' RNA ligase family protein [Ensifer sp.]
MKTRKPLILTARIEKTDLETFDRLRTAHFPPDRNFLTAHLTMFHRLPGEYCERIVEALQAAAGKRGQIRAEVAGVRHLGSGVAFTIISLALDQLYRDLRSAFTPWLGGQDLQRWQPHITVQNKVSRSVADTLHQQLTHDFEPRSVMLEGLDLWMYMGGPWQLERTVSFTTESARSEAP